MGSASGGLVSLKSGEWWFLHFQSSGVWGRIVHLQPVVWKNGWPLIGKDINNDGIGEPVLEWDKPDVGKTFHAIATSFEATPGTWIGAKVGLFALNPKIASGNGYGDFEFFRFH